MRQLDLIVLLARAEELVEAEQLMRDEEGDIDLARNPIVHLKAGSVDQKDVGEGGEASSSVELRKSASVERKGEQKELT